MKNLPSSSPTPNLAPCNLLTVTIKGLWRGTGGAQESRGQEAGEKRVGSGIPKVVGTGGKLRNIAQHCIIFCNRSCTEAGTMTERGRNRE